LAVHVEDHPVEYGDFEGLIPVGEYGAGAVIVWDRGVWVCTGDAGEAYERGKLKFRLLGEKLRGGWTLVRTGFDKKNGKDHWLLIKEHDGEAKSEADYDVAAEEPLSVLSGRTLEDLSATAVAKKGKAKRRAPRLTADRISGAKRAPMPLRVSPQLATEVTKPPSGSGWVHEIKYDGYRTLCRLEDGSVRFITRKGQDWTDRYGRLADAFSGLRGHSAIIDGEVVVQNAQGHSDFGALQQALSEGATDRLTFFSFDLLYLDGFDLTDVKLLDRKQALSTLLDGLVTGTSPLQLGGYVEASGPEVFEHAARMSLEGIVSKQVSAPYRAGRSTTWRKTKCRLLETFMILGFTDSKAGALGALLLADPQADPLRYAGKVGTGFSAREATEARATLDRIGIPTNVPTADVVWVEPVCRAHVEYRGRTPAGILRQAVVRKFEPGVITDSDRGEAKRPSPRRFITDTALAGIDLTNPDRVMFGGPTKLDLALYYAKVGDWILPHIINRPLSLVRCPTGAKEDCFYQRHAFMGLPRSVRRVRLGKGNSEHEGEYLWLADAEGFLSLTQFGVIELHPWACQVDRRDRPDRMIFDLDPDEAVGWPSVIDSAFALRDRLEALNLPAFVKSTGGKGLHIVVPLVRRHSWDAMRSFARAFVESAARDAPRQFTANLAKKQRAGRIFIDHLRNIRGATAVAPYSLRAREGAPVATPLAWEELRRLKDPVNLNHATVPDRLSRLGRDPWQEMQYSAGVLTKEAREKVGLKA
jgi:DNA ligase D